MNVTMSLLWRFVERTKKMRLTIEDARILTTDPWITPNPDASGGRTETNLLSFKFCAPTLNGAFWPSEPCKFSALMDICLYWGWLCTTPMKTSPAKYQIFSFRLKKCNFYVQQHFSSADGKIMIPAPMLLKPTGFQYINFQISNFEVWPTNVGALISFTFTCENCPRDHQVDTLRNRDVDLLTWKNEKKIISLSVIAEVT